MKLYIKRYPFRGEFPSVEGLVATSCGELSYSKAFGWVTLQNYTTKAPDYWLQEIELPSDDEILDAVLIKQDKDQTQFLRGIDFILNKLKVETK